MNADDIKPESSEESSSEEENGSDGEGQLQNGKKSKEIYLPGDPIDDKEQLVHDESAYKIFHEAQTGAPCLTFDILKDKLGDNRAELPATFHIVSGTNSEQGRANHIIVMKVSNMHGVREQTSDDESGSEDESDEKPVMQAAMVLHRGCVNRIRSTKVGEKHIAATWSERKSVHLWDLTKQLEATENTTNMQKFVRNEQKKISPLFTFTGHMDEGYGMDWSPTEEGHLLTGDCKSNIHLWKPRDDGSWHVDQRSYKAHTDSVEDIQWSPNEKNVFMTCSADKTVKVWDTRAKPSTACMMSTIAHESDVNVLNWNRNEPFIVSGGDDAMLKVWDLRQFKSGTPIATFKHHTKSITSVEWHPTDSSVFAASSSDNQVTQWDLAVEPVSVDDNGVEAKIKDIPPQLLFIHQGQTDIKEIHWHPQIPGLILSTAQSGLNIFKTISV